MRLFGEDLIDQNVVEKILISVIDEFEVEIVAMEESCDLKTLLIVELLSKLEAHEQRTSIKFNELVEHAF